MSIKILITGASGSIGRKLVKELSVRGDEVTIFTRNLTDAEKKLPGVDINLSLKI